MFSPGFIDHVETIEALEKLTRAAIANGAGLMNGAALKKADALRAKLNAIDETYRDGFTGEEENYLFQRMLAFDLMTTMFQKTLLEMLQAQMQGD